MSRTKSIETLEARRADLQRQLRELDIAIKAVKARELADQRAAAVAALERRGLLGADLESLLSRLDKLDAPAAEPAPIANTTTDN